MNKKALLVFLSLGVLPLALGACSDAGDPHQPIPPANMTANATITVTDLVGDWDNLVVQGDMTDADGVAMTQDGPTWTADISDLQPGSYDFGIYFDDGTKALVEVVPDLVLEVAENYDVSGDLEATVEPTASTGFNLMVINHDPAYDNIKIKGSMNAWTPAITGHSDDGLMWYLHFAAGAVVAGDYEWGVIEDDGSEFGIWLVEGPNLQFTIPEEGAPTGTTSYTISAPLPVTDLTLNCDMTGYVGDITVVGISGTFNNWADPPTTILTDENSDGIYTVTIEVEQDQNGDAPVKFKFRVNGAWESVPAACGVDDGFGGYNRTVEIFTSPVTYSSPYEGCPE